MNKITIKSSRWLVLAMTLAACSSAPTVQDYPDTASATDEVSKFDADLNAAITNQVDVLSPRNFKSAQESLADAKKSVDKQRDAKDTLHNVAIGRAYLVRSNEVAQTARNTFGDVVSARQAAVAAGAPTILSKEFQKTDSQLRDVTADIEKNDMKDAKEARMELQLKYLDLELRSIKLAKVGAARDQIVIAVKEGAKEYAPRSLAQAEKSVLDTEAFITANRHDVAQINSKSDETLNIANHLVKITRDSKSGKKTSSEDQALRLEGEQNKVADKQGEINAKETQLTSKQNQLDNKQSQIESTNAANTALAAQNSNLSSEQAFNQRFEDARAEFTKGEAEVYKQGNILTIRLRGLEFPANQAVLKGSNFPLLAKVQKVISGFGKSAVTIEGHTDSVGGKAANEKLSAARADAVKEYLAANANGQDIDLKAVGYGYQKPLATNKTPAGRAQNRRVDVLIQPEGK